MGPPADVCSGDRVQAGDLVGQIPEGARNWIRNPIDAFILRRALGAGLIPNGDADKDIYITETGWNDHPRWTLAVRPAQRIQYTLDALQYAETHWPFVKMVAIWAFRFPAPQKSYMDYYTLVTPEFVKKPIYEALQEYAQEK